jgi:predicted transcriptional regulator
MELTEVRRIIAEGVSLGYMMAVKAYDPAQDVLKRKDAETWIRSMGVKCKLQVLIDKGMVTPIRKGKSRNSALYFSKEEIKKAIVAMSVDKIMIHEQLNIKTKDYEQFIQKTV